MKTIHFTLTLSSLQGGRTIGRKESENGQIGTKEILRTSF